MSIENIPVDDALLALLQNCGLETSDIGNGQHINFYGIYADDTLQGIVGIEPLGECALLRSLCVTESGRQLGYAAKLVEHAELSVQQQGIHKLYLLTELALGYFEKKGYKQIDRATTPKAIQVTAQFSTLCAQTSWLLFKAL